MAALAAAAGYADQPHLSRECSALAGVTPSALLARTPGTSGPFTAPTPPVLQAG